uniref:NADH-ubiquinone oxidoreductase chain 4 n=1 Tax=Graphocaecilius interpretatus TaxID=2596997 RepID=A0A8K1ZFL6_9NEOP|nr:NADH dehydrogenase subunit 4 [Graphocaecilius interpretatus]
MLKFMFMLILIPLCLCVNWLYIQFMFLILTFMFIMELSYFNIYSSVSYGFGLDLMSYVLILLSIWICFLMIMGSESIILSKNFELSFMILITMLLFFLILSFFTMNLFMFYLFFESSLIPTFMLIMGWGYQSERIQASIYLLMYTLVSSLPLLLMIFYFYQKINLSMMFEYVLNMEINFLMFMFIYSAFLVKLPMFLVHLWLPKAHVEAPVAGSMILAGVLLKLGGYGILRISFILFKFINKYVWYLVILSLLGGVLISLNCLRQSDVKLLIAYSSVSHMGIMLSGTFNFSLWGLSSTLLMMISHGLCSSGLFFLINMYYERVGSRSLLLLKGMIHYLPKLGLWWFLFCAMNMAAPPSLNLLSEIGLINSIMAWSWVNMITLGLMSFFAGGYSLYMFSYTQHGKCLHSIYSFSMCNIREYMILIFHWVPLNFLILNSEIMMSWL